MTIPRSFAIPVAVALGLFGAIVVSLFYFLISGEAGALLIAAGFLCPLIVLSGQLLFFRIRARKFDIFAPLNFFALSFLFGVALQTMLIVCVRGYTTDTFLLLGKPPEFLATALIYVNLGAIALSSGFLVRVRPIDVSRFGVIRNDTWNKSRLTLVCGALVAIAVISAMLYLHRMGISISSLADKLSAKRRLVVEGAAYQYASLGYFLLGASLTDNVFSVLFALFASSRKSLLSSLGAVCIAVGLFTCIIPVVTSSRSSILVLIIYSVVTWHYLRNSLSAAKLAGAVLACAVILALLGVLRAQKGNVSAMSGSDTNILEETTRNLIGHRHFNSVAVTAQMIDAVPAPLQYQFGSTYLLWLIAPIPRQLWIEKPVVRVGQVVGMAAFERTADRTGVPPGLIGELYWNFGFLGPVFGMFGIGVFLNLLYNSFAPLLRENKNAMLIYFPIMLSVCFGPGDFTGIVTSIVSGTAINLLILKFIGTSRTSRKVLVGANQLPDFDDSQRRSKQLAQGNGLLR